MAKKKNKQTDKIDLPLFAYLLPILVAVVIVVTLYFIARPQVLGIVESREEIEAQQALLEQLVGKKTTLESQSQDRLREYLRSVNTVLPNTKPVFSFVSGLAGLGQEHPQVVIGDYTINPGSLATASAELAETPGDLSEMKTELELRGSYNPLIAYLKDLYQLAPMIGITSVEVNGTIDPNSTEEQAVTLSMDVDVFYALSPETIGKVTDPLPSYAGDFETTLSRLQTFESYRDDRAQYLDVDQQRQNPFRF